MRDLYKPLAHLRVSNIYGITSEATILQTEQGVIQHGCQAMQLSNGSSGQVKLSPSVVVDQLDALNKVLNRPSTYDGRFIRPMSHDEEGLPDFQILVNDHVHARYEVVTMPKHRAGPSILTMPQLPVDPTEAPEKLVRRLIHLAKYFNVRDVRNN